MAEMTPKRPKPPPYCALGAIPPPILADTAVSANRKEAACRDGNDTAEDARKTEEALKDGQKRHKKQPSTPNPEASQVLRHFLPEALEEKRNSVNMRTAVFVCLFGAVFTVPVPMEKYGGSSSGQVFYQPIQQVPIFPQVPQFPQFPQFPINPFNRINPFNPFAPIIPFNPLNPVNPLPPLAPEIPIPIPVPVDPAQAFPLNPFSGLFPFGQVAGLPGTAGQAFGVQGTAGQALGVPGTAGQVLGGRRFAGVGRKR
ncbi:uncharacterized protein [Ambystoma mexicanum]|uniref:uncharacterized protein n=1 Tax=Ambystoma mexicanum TaxID=8296 RepID=UPI0037E7B915